jgi:hypothetical protein
MKPYVVRAGDYLSKLSHSLGFDADKVWGDAKNADLKKARTDPNMLQAGDILFVPDEPKPKLDLIPESENDFVGIVPMVTVSVVVDEDGIPLANAKYTIQGLGTDDKVFTTDKDGRVKFDAAVHVREAVVRFVDSGHSMKVGIGDLDPIDTDSGARMRLTHLGFFGPVLEGDEQYEAQSGGQLAAAIAAFQRAKGASVTGLLDDATKKLLTAAHKS